MRIIVLILLYLFTTASNAQVTGGKNSFSFLQTANSAKIAAIGGDNVSSFGDDITMVYQNPALLSEEMANKTSLNFTTYKSGLKLTSLQYVIPKSKIGVFSAGLTYLNFGVVDSGNSLDR